MRDVNKINEDMDLSQKLSEEVKNYFSEDISIEEARSRLLSSELYQLWKSKNRVFQIEIESEQALMDLKSAYIFEEHCKVVDNLTQKYFDHNDLVRNENSSELDLFLNQVYEISIPVEKLSYLIAEYSRKIDLDKPLEYKHLFAILSGVTIIGINEDQLKKIANNDLALDTFIHEIESFRK